MCICTDPYIELTASLELEAVEEGDDDDGDEGREGEGEEEFEDTLLRGTVGSTALSSETLLLLLHSSSSSDSTSSVTSFSMEKQKNDIQLSKVKDRAK